MATSPYSDWIGRKCSTPRASRVFRVSTAVGSISTQSPIGSPTPLALDISCKENSLDDLSQVSWTPSPNKASFSISQLVTPTHEQESLVCWTPSSPPLSAQNSLADWTPSCSPASLLERSYLEVRDSETYSESKLCSTRSTLRPNSTLLGKQLSYSHNSLDVEDSAFEASESNEKSHVQTKGDITFSGKYCIYH